MTTLPWERNVSDLSVKDIVIVGGVGMGLYLLYQLIQKQQNNNPNGPPQSQIPPDFGVTGDGW